MTVMGDVLIGGVKTRAQFQDEAARDTYQEMVAKVEKARQKIPALEKASGLDLTLHHPLLAEDAVKDFEAGNVGGFLCKAENGNQFHLEIVQANYGPLQKRGLYEEALLDAWVGCRVNWHGYDLDDLLEMFEDTDRDKLRALGDPLPGPGPFTLYRGAGGREPERRVSGLSWTSDLVKARWFARRAGLFGLADPAVYRVRVKADDVLVYLHEGERGRKESEFILYPPPRHTIRRVEGITKKMIEAAEAAMASQSDEAIQTAEAMLTA